MEQQNIFGFVIDKELWILIQLPLALVFTTITHLVFGVVFRRLDKKLVAMKNIWTKSLIPSIRLPANTLIWTTGFFYTVEIVRKEYDIQLLAGIPSLTELTQVTILTWFVLRFIRSFQINYVEKYRKLDPKFDVTTSDLVSKIVFIVAIVLGGLVALDTLGVSIAGILAFGGVGGIAIGFAAQELIANYFGGLMLYLDRPFKVGERINSAELDIYGVVESIGWRQTKIRRIDMRLLHVPNSTFVKISVINNTRRSNRYIYEFVGIRYDDSHLLKVIVDDIEKMVRNHPEIDTTERLAVNFMQFAASSLDIFIYAYTKSTDWNDFHAIKQDVLIKAMDIITGHGAEFAFPTSTLHIAGIEQEQKQQLLETLEQQSGPLKIQQETERLKLQESLKHFKVEEEPEQLKPSR